MMSESWMEPNDFINQLLDLAKRERGEQQSWAFNEAAATIEDQAQRIANLEAENKRLREALEPSGSTKAAYSGEGSKMDSKLSKFFDDAIMEATRAVLKYPQPCKIPPIPKLAEECGEAIQAANKCIEGKGSLEAVRGELVQTVAVIIRLYLEGDKTLGLPPVSTVDLMGDEHE